MVKRRRDKIMLPSSGAGLVRYMDEEGQGLKVKPEHVLMAAVGIVVLKTVWPYFF